MLYFIVYQKYFSDIRGSALKKVPICDPYNHVCAFESNTTTIYVLPTALNVQILFEIYKCKIIQNFPKVPFYSLTCRAHSTIKVLLLLIQISSFKKGAE